MCAFFCLGPKVSIGASVTGSKGCRNDGPENRRHTLQPGFSDAQFTRHTSLLLEPDADEENHSRAVRRLMQCNAVQKRDH